MITEAERRDVATALDDARRTRHPIPPPTDTWGGLEVEDAYAIQALQIEERLRDGAKIVGWKVGLTSQAMQDQLGIDEPDYGPLLNEMKIESGGAVEVGGLIAPRIEGEIAFRLGRDLLGPNLGLEDVAGAVEEVVLALEIIDSRILDWKITLPDTVSDRGSCALFVVADRGRPLADVDVAGLDLVLLSGSRTVAEGRGDAVLGNPLSALVWLADSLAPLGESLRAGQVVLVGAVHASLPLEPGTTVKLIAPDCDLEGVSVRCV